MQQNIKNGYESTTVTLNSHCTISNRMQTSSSLVLLGRTLLKYFMHQVVRAFLDTLLLPPMYKYTSFAGKTYI